MDWKIFFATFSAVFLAELGDKTQMAGFTFAARSKMPLVVFLGSLSAYAVVTFITVLMGGTLGKFIKPEFVKYGTASLFIIIGILIFLGKI